jgi:hypothetical protein
MLLPFAILYNLGILNLPWALLAVISIPFLSGGMLLMLRRIIALPLAVQRGPFEHFSILDETTDTRSSVEDSSTRRD